MPTTTSLGGILLVTFSREEATAVLAAFTKDKPDDPVFHVEWKTYYDLGKWGGVPVLMVQCEIGSATPGGFLLTVQTAIRHLQTPGHHHVRHRLRTYGLTGSNWARSS